MKCIKFFLIISSVLILAGCSVRNAKLTQNEKETLAKFVEYENPNGDIKTDRMLIDVILNRIDSSDYPNTLDSVLNQTNQFIINFDKLNSLEVDTKTLKMINEELIKRNNKDVISYTLNHMDNTLYSAQHHKEYISENYSFYSSDKK